MLRDVLQFATMLVLVRILAPADYGAAALAQAVVGVTAVISFATFSTHALQVRDPAQIDWQAHFTAAVVINSIVFCLTLGVAWWLSHIEPYRPAALLLAGLAVLFLIEMPGTLRHRMLEANHDWKRFRILLMIGTLLGLASGLIVAMLGGGAWALVVQPSMFGLPAAIDLFLTGKFRPNWSWSWQRYRATAVFGVSRVGVGTIGRARVLVEQAALASVFQLGALGIFSRAMGLATLLAGRIGSIAMLSLYPVITRAETGSDHFRRLAGLILRGVCWVAIPAAALVGVAAADVVGLLYGPKWSEVTPLLALAVVAVALGGISSTMSSLLLANDDVRASSLLDIATGLSGIGLALWLVPIGAENYLAGLGAQGVIVIVASVALLLNKRAITRSGIADAFVPALVAAAAGIAAVLAARRVGTSGNLVVRLAVDTTVFGLAYLATLRLVFVRVLAELVEVAPGVQRLVRFVRLPRN